MILNYYVYYSAAQKDEMRELYDILEDQKAEIHKLNNMLDRIEDPARGMHFRSFKKLWRWGGGLCCINNYMSKN